MSNNKKLDQVRALKQQISTNQQAIQIGQDYIQELTAELESARSNIGDLVQENIELNLSAKRLQES